MIRLACPASGCATTFVLHPEAIDERVRQVAEHYLTHDPLTGQALAVELVEVRNSEEIRKANDELRDFAHRRPCRAFRRRA